MPGEGLGISSVTPTPTPFLFLFLFLFFSPVNRGPSLFLCWSNRTQVGSTWGGVPCEGVYVGLSWEVVQGVFSAEGPGLGCHKHHTHPVLGLKLGFPIGGLWRVSLLLQLLRWNPPSQCDGGLGAGERGLESPQYAAQGWEEGSRAHHPRGQGPRGVPRAAHLLPSACFPSPGPGKSRGEVSRAANLY